MAVPGGDCPPRYFYYPNDKAACAAEDDIVSSLDGGESWFDPSFSPAAALYCDPTAPPHGSPPADLVEWNSLNRGEVKGCAHARTFTSSRAGENPIARGALRDGWLLSAMAALPAEALQTILVSDRHAEEHGVYTCRFFKQGRAVYVHVDDRLPCDARSRPLFARSADANEVWPCVIEKAYAKLHGCYERLALGANGGVHAGAGRLEHALQDLMGAGTMTYGGARFRALEGESLAQVVELIESTIAAGGVACCVADAPTPSVGISAGSAYVITRAEAVEVAGVGDDPALDTYLLQLSLPFAFEVTWQGNWGHGHPVWDAQPGVKAKINPPDEVEADPHTFWMEISDFLVQFSRLVLSSRVGASHIRFARGSWMPGSSTSSAVGCPRGGSKPQRDAFASLPQFTFELDIDTDVFVVVSQDDERWQREPAQEAQVEGSGTGADSGAGTAAAVAACPPEPTAIGFMVMRTSGDNRRSHAFHPDRVAAAPHAFTYARSVSCCAPALEAGRYAVVPCTYDPVPQPASRAGAAAPPPRTFVVEVYGNKKVRGDSKSDGTFTDAEMRDEDEDEGDDDEDDYSDEQAGLVLEGADGDDACEREDDGCEVALLSRNVGELASVLSQLGKDVEKLEGRVRVLES